jgi:exopolyphosphatase/guanosine-5'-triphosphate,3'-diphosphate pyrophosphatase
VTGRHAGRRRGALIDLGTNSVRLVIAEMAADGGLTVLLQDKKPVALGQGSYDDDRLAAEAMDRAYAALEIMKATAGFHKVDYVRAVATSALREAVNRDAFLEKVYDGLQLDLKVVSGLEEARLIWAGVSANLNLGPGPSLIMDIGGGSVELIVDERGREPLLDSLPLGAARLSGRFGLLEREAPLGQELYERLKDHVKVRTRRFAAAARRLRLKRCWGCSGALENLARVWSKLGGSDDRARLALIPASALSELGLFLSSLSLAERRKTPGLDRDKAPMIVAGCAVVDALLEELGVEELQAVEFGLKHGLVQEFAEACGGRPSGKGSPREDGVRRLGRRCLFDEEHAEAVAEAATKIRDAFVAQGLLTDNPAERELLRYGGLLHDAGKFLSYDGHQIHGWYLVRNSSLLGFDEDELELVAYLVLNHRGPKRLKKDSFPEMIAAVESAAKGRHAHWPQLGLCLWLAELLEARRQGAVEGFELALRGDELGFLVRARVGSSLEQELALFDKAAKRLESVFGRRFAGARQA